MSTSKRSWRIWPNRIKTERSWENGKRGGEILVILLWARVSTPPKGEREESHKIPWGPHKAQWASGPRPRISRQENNWVTLGDHNATRDAHNRKSQWKSVERSQFSPRQLNPILSTFDLEHLNPRLNEVKMNKNRCSGSKSAFLIQVNQREPWAGGIGRSFGAGVRMWDMPEGGNKHTRHFL